MPVSNRMTPFNNENFPTIRNIWSSNAVFQIYRDPAEKLYQWYQGIWVISEDIGGLKWLMGFRVVIWGIYGDQ